MWRQRNIRRAASALLALLLVCALAVPAAAVETDLRLYRNHPQESLPFHAANLFPGDSVSQVFRLRVFYNNSITVHFRADVRPGSEKLGEVLKCRITLNGAQVYDGLMAAMPESLSHTINSPESELEYQITAYLDTSVGNEYMAKELYADFRWWVEKQDEPDLDNPHTGDDFPMAAMVSAMCGSGLLILYLLTRIRKKEEPNEGE